MTIEVHVELRARDTVNAVKRGDVIAVIDVLRCSSTIITAIVNGASKIIPVRTVEKGRQMKQRHPNYILAGERRGFKPRGFELGNSPGEFTRETIYGRGIILTTTDGTKAFDVAQKAKASALVGGFLNAEAVGTKLHEIACKNNCGVSLIACGRQGKFSLEDFLCAGKILEKMPMDKLAPSDSALAALLVSKAAGDKILELVSSSEHGKELQNIGLLKDIKTCLRINRYTDVPVFMNNEITRKAHEVMFDARNS